MRNDILQLVGEALGTAAANARPLSGGCIGEVYRVELEDGDGVVAKVDRSAAPRLDIEGYMLQYLAQHSELPVPAVRHTTPSLLIMDFAGGDSRFSNAAQADAAEHLAALHAISPKDNRHGLERDTLIGSLPQPNGKRDTWMDFFRDQRLLHMADAALREGRMDRAFHKRLNQFADRLDEFIEEPDHPSLLHGDVWTTNVLAHNGKITAFLDPAVYYGHPEIELAFATLFGTFGTPFFDRYAEVGTLRPGFFELRRDLYNIYPLLVHTRIFGSSYLSGIDATLRKLGF